MISGWDGWRRVFWTVAIALVFGAVVARNFSIGLWICLALAAASAAAALFARSRAQATGELPPATSMGSGIASLMPLMRGVFEQVPDAIMLLDRNGRAVFANRAMRQVIGTPDVERKHVSALFRIPSVLQAVDAVSRTGKTETLEISFRVPVEQFYEAYIARADLGSPVIVIVLHDLTAAKRAEQMRADFVANASHELRTPLAAVSGFIDTLRGHARDDSEAREKFLGIMSVEAGRMRRLIDDLLSLTRIELNEHVRPSSVIRLEDVVRDAASALAPLAEIDNMKIEIARVEDLPPILGERDELIQLFQNLIHNAIKYGKDNGKICVSFGKTPSPGGRNADAFVYAAVKDNGEGIPADAVPRLTERFYRVDVKRSRERGGTGLGLAIVKHILNRHRGRLQIESQQGEGSTFTVFLPVASELAIAPVTELS